MAVKRMMGKVIYKEILAGKTWLLGVSLEEECDFVPGQFVSLKVNDEGLRRSYSIASLPGKNNIDLVIDVTPNGVGSKYIMALRVGDSVEVLGFLGKFIIREDDLMQKEMLFVGTGTGIVPLKVMIEDLLVRKQYKGKVNLIWGMRYETDLYWQSEIDKLQREYDNFHFHIALSRPGEKWPGVAEHVGDVIERLSFQGSQTSVFLCGNPKMIEEMKEKIIKKGVLEEKILFERYA